MSRSKKITAAVIAVVLCAAVIAAVCLIAGKRPSHSDATTAAPESEPVWTTENWQENLKFKKTDTLTVSDSADGDFLSIPVENLRAGTAENGCVLFYADGGLDPVKAAVESLSDENTRYSAYLYGENMRIEKTLPDGSVNTYCIRPVKDSEGARVYELSDCRAFFTDGGAKYGAFRFPYYYLDESESFSAMEHGIFGDTFRITVSRTEFLSFYENSALYIIKEGTENDFSLEHTYAAADKGNAYPVRFVFGQDSEGYRTVTVQMGSAVQ